jgi:DNA-binding NtrC family response regulator
VIQSCKQRSRIHLRLGHQPQRSARTRESAHTKSPLFGPLVAKCPAIDQPSTPVNGRFHAVVTAVRNPAGHSGVREGRMQRVIRGLIVEDYETLRNAIVRSTQPHPTLRMELVWDAAASQAEAFALIKTDKYQLALVDAALTPDENNRDGLAIAVALYHNGAQVFVLTAHRLDAADQLLLNSLHIPIFIKPMALNELVAHITLAAVAPREQRVPMERDMLVYIAKLVREVEGPLSEIVKQVQALVVEGALAETSGNKMAAARLLGVDRHFIERALVYLPPKKERA